MGGGNVGDGVIVDLTALPRRLEIEPDRRIARTSACVTLAELNRAADAANLRLPPDPSSAAWATAGGAVSTNAAGARSVRYGSVRRWVEAVELVTADGETTRAAAGPAEPGRGARSLRDGGSARHQGRLGGDRRPLSAHPQELVRLCARRVSRLRRSARSGHRRRRHARRRDGYRMEAGPDPSSPRRPPSHAPIARLAHRSRRDAAAIRPFSGRAARQDVSRAGGREGRGGAPRRAGARRLPRM